MNEINKKKFHIIIFKITAEQTGWMVPLTTFDLLNTIESKQKLKQFDADALTAN